MVVLTLYSYIKRDVKALWVMVPSVNCVLPCLASAIISSTGSQSRSMCIWACHEGEYQLTIISYYYNHILDRSHNTLARIRFHLGNIQNAVMHVGISYTLITDCDMSLMCFVIFGTKISDQL